MATGCYHGNTAVQAGVGSQAGHVQVYSWRGKVHMIPMVQTSDKRKSFCAFLCLQDLAQLCTYQCRLLRGGQVGSVQVYS